MKLYKTPSGLLAEKDNTFYKISAAWDELLISEAPLNEILGQCIAENQISTEEASGLEPFLAPIGQQEVWASGVTYMRSRSARMEESKEAGGDSFYDRVYQADRPELFFKGPHYRVKGPGEAVRIRKDSQWNVPEPELTLVITPNGKLVGYTIGNDMSSRDIEGENPLYLPQAKTYDGSLALGPCIYLTETPLDREAVEISLTIVRKGETVFSDQIQLARMKRNFQELIDYLYRELSFPMGCYLMTGTGIIPEGDFSLEIGDEISIEITGIGKLVNRVDR